MHLLVATRQGQGPADFCWTVEGEPVRLDDPCDRDLASREDGEARGGCGCSRAFHGLGSLVATTTAIVVDSPLTRSEVFLALHSSLAQAGLVSEQLDPEDVVAIEEELDWLLGLAADFAVGAVLERDFDEIRVRH